MYITYVGATGGMCTQVDKGAGSLWTWNESGITFNHRAASPAHFCLGTLLTSLISLAEDYVAQLRFL